MKLKRNILSIAGFALLLVTGCNQSDKLHYKDPSLPVETRVSDLISRMTREEKVGQLSTLLGWQMYNKQGDSVTVSDEFREAVANRHIGALWATLRADAWTEKNLINGLNPGLAAKATNALQKYVVENTRLGIPLLLSEECPHGHMAIGTTVFPTSIGQSSSWNPDLIQKMASVIAAEARVQGAHVGYGPVLDLAREPRWSRVEETYGEDPLLNSMMGVAMVKGFQGTDLQSGRNVISTLKHFTAYGVPEGGHNGGSVSIGMRELHQSYLPPFRAAVEAGALSVMTAYNSIDGVPCTANPMLLTDILKEQWGFEGFVVSDLGSISGIRSSHHVAENPADAAEMALNAGVDADLGGNGFDQALLSALEKGIVSTQALDQAVSRVLRMKFQMGLFENPYVNSMEASKLVKNPDHVALAREVARESLVLLKNSGNLLPLDKQLNSIAVIGPNADNVYNQLGDYTAPQPDSSVITVLQGIKNKVSASTKVVYVKGCAIRDTTTTNIKEAVDAARKATIAVVVLGGSSARDFSIEHESSGAAKVSKTGIGQQISDMESGEGFDRATLKLMGKQMELLKEVVRTGTPVVLVLIKGRPLLLNWPAEEVLAIVDAWYPGQEGGKAIADVLFGDYNPAGRLPISVPKYVGQLPVYYNAKRPGKHDYVEMSAQPLYSFGHGLSYSTFLYTDLQIQVGSATGEADGQVGQSKSARPQQEDLQVNIQFKLKNTSERAGDEVVQLYLHDQVSSMVTPSKELKKFQRIHLKAGEEKIVSFKLKAQDLMLINAAMKWVVEPGMFDLMIGASSQDIRLESTFVIEEGIAM